jgi:microsomal epoxide hydrolase
VDLRERLAQTRFPDQAPGEPWAYGTDVGYLRELVEYWRDSFDWRAQEARLTPSPQFKAALGGIDLHFLHVPGRGPDPLPLLLSHGWPGSVLEFLDLIPRLTDPARFGGDPADAFTVVAPSLPGYGLSFAPGQPRFGAEAIADCLAELMTDVLGYGRFAAQGGDWGAFVTARLGHAYADRLVGIHLNLLPLRRDPAAVADPTPEERRYLGELARSSRRRRATSGSRAPGPRRWPSRSPTRRPAWRLGSSRSSVPGPTAAATWSQCSRGTSSWPTSPSTGSRRHRLVVLAYYARMHGPWPIPGGGTVDVPTGYCEFPCEILRPPRSLARAPSRTSAAERDAPRRPLRGDGAARGPGL